METSKEEPGELERQITPHLMFAFTPALFAITGLFMFLATLFPLVGAYNYLRGVPSPLDQAILALLGSDLSRLALLVLSIVGLLVGLYLSGFATEKLTLLKRDGVIGLSRPMYLFLFSLWWTVPVCFFSITSLYESHVYGMTSHFTSALGFSMLGGYQIGFSMPVLARYIRLVLYSRSVHSQVLLECHRSGTGIIRPVKDLTLRITPQNSNP
ncbi:hypothetical protein EU538_13100 [Candidatus Thorarchaeota archaeon]|nr:MAG: hypothetical protein EU538_13100 [Candidatus Thorarchaeota archaeon]